LADGVGRLYRAYRQPILVEEFIDGDELTVGVVGHRPQKALGIMRVLPRQKQPGPFVYSLEMKRDWEHLLHYESPAQISAADAATVERATLAAWRALGCRDVARFDFRLREGVPYFLEVNPLPGLSPKSGDLVMLARGYGIEHRELISRILDAASERVRSEGMREKE
jgi:D-alanine-D-alanine ligase